MARRTATVASEGPGRTLPLADPLCRHGVVAGAAQLHQLDAGLLRHLRPQRRAHGPGSRWRRARPTRRPPAADGPGRAARRRRPPPPPACRGPRPAAWCHLPTDLVRAQQAPPGPIGDGGGQRALAGARQTAHEEQDLSGLAQVAQGQGVQHPRRSVRLPLPPVRAADMPPWPGRRPSARCSGAAVVPGSVRHRHARRRPRSAPQPRAARAVRGPWRGRRRPRPRRRSAARRRTRCSRGCAHRRRDRRCPPPGGRRDRRRPTPERCARRAARRGGRASGSHGPGSPARPARRAGDRRRGPPRRSWPSTRHPGLSAVAAAEIVGDRRAPAWNPATVAATSSTHRSTSVPCSHECGQPPLLGEGAHDDHVVEWHAVHDDVGHAQVDVGSQAAIELDLPPAVRFTGYPVGEVNEVVAHGLAQLVDPVAHEDEDRDVGLDHLRPHGARGRHRHRHRHLVARSRRRLPPA